LIAVCSVCGSDRIAYDDDDRTYEIAGESQISMYAECFVCGSITMFTLRVSDSETITSDYDKDKICEIRLVIYGKRYNGSIDNDMWDFLTSPEMLISIYDRVSDGRNIGEEVDVVIRETIGKNDTMEEEDWGRMMS
jgi:hypothetical protein